ncbi:MAG: 23S rRNA (pseudouridine(1915)-N(3))-methyltransferase RlmH [Actinomycetota bacterium]
MSARRAPRLQIVAVGRARPPHEAPAREYEKRIAERVPLRVDEVTAEPLQGGEEVARRREAERIRGRLLPRAHVVALDPAGRAPASSEALAAWLGRRLEDPRPTAIVVGGAAGLHAELVGACDERLSLGPLTLPHQLARVVLAEQVYRGLCILAGHPYAH